MMSNPVTPGAKCSSSACAAPAATLPARNRELPGEQDQRADQGDDKGRETRQQQRHTLCARRGQRHSHWNLTHSPSSPKVTEKEPEALGAPRQKAATHANERVLPPCERVIA